MEANILADGDGDLGDFCKDRLFPGFGRRSLVLFRWGASSTTHALGEGDKIGDGCSFHINVLQKSLHVSMHA